MMTIPVSCKLLAKRRQPQYSCGITLYGTDEVMRSNRISSSKKIARQTERFRFGGLFHAHLLF